MKDNDALPVSTPTAHTTSTATTTAKKEASDSSIFGKGRYKFWALTAILLLALWSMFTGTVTLRWSVGNLDRLSDAIDIPIREDLDVLEMEETEKMVKHMWDAYTSSRRIRLPRFWQEAFEAAYEDLTSDDPGVRDTAISEIAKMSLRTFHVEPPPFQSSTNLQRLVLIKREGNTGNRRDCIINNLLRNLAPAPGDPCLCLGFCCSAYHSDL